MASEENPPQSGPAEEPNAGADSTDGGAEPTTGGPPAAPDEASIREELGIGSGRATIDPEDVEKLLRGALEGYGQVLAAAEDAGEGTSGAGTEGRIPPMGAEIIDQNLELLRDVNLQVKVELGRGKMYLKDILRLGQGSVVELERLAGDPLDIYVNDKVIARGEVLVLNENFCIRITQVFHPEELRQSVTGER